MTPLTAREAAALVAEAVDAGRLDRAPAERLGASLRDAAVREVVLEAAHASKLASKGDVVTVSLNVFIPLTSMIILSLLLTLIVNLLRR